MFSKKETPRLLTTAIHNHDGSVLFKVNDKIVSSLKKDLNAFTFNTHLTNEQYTITKDVAKILAENKMIKNLTISGLIQFEKGALEELLKSSTLITLDLSGSLTSLNLLTSEDLLTLANNTRLDTLILSNRLRTDDNFIRAFLQNTHPINIEFKDDSRNFSYFGDELKGIVDNQKLITDHASFLKERAIKNTIIFSVLAANQAANAENPLESFIIDLLPLINSMLPKKPVNYDYILMIENALKDYHNQRNKIFYSQSKGTQEFIQQFTQDKEKWRANPDLAKIAIAKYIKDNPSASLCKLLKQLVNVDPNKYAEILKFENLTSDPTSKKGPVSREVSMHVKDEGSKPSLKDDAIKKFMAINEKISAMEIKEHDHHSAILQTYLQEFIIPVGKKIMSPAEEGQEAKSTSQVNKEIEFQNLLFYFNKIDAVLTNNDYGRLNALNELCESIININKENDYTEALAKWIYFMACEELHKITTDDNKATIRGIVNQGAGLYSQDAPIFNAQLASLLIITAKAARQPNQAEVLKAAVDGIKITNNQLKEFRDNNVRPFVNASAPSHRPIGHGKR